MRCTHRVGLRGKFGLQLGRRSVWRGARYCIKKASRRIAPARLSRAWEFRRQDDDVKVVQALPDCHSRGKSSEGRHVMAILCDTQIRELIGIEPFEDNLKRPGKISYGVSSYGYDLRVGSAFKIFTNVNTEIVDPKKFSEASFVTIDCDEYGRDHVLI